MNKIWCKREEKASDRIKASFSHELASLRRQLELNNKYDDVVSKQEINRLKGQLKLAKKEIEMRLIIVRNAILQVWK